MDLFNSASDFLGKGLAGLNHGKDVVTLKMQISEKERQREKLCAQLGDAVYLEHKGSVSAPSSHEDLFKAIEQVEEEKAALERELELDGVKEGGPADAGAATTEAAPLAAEKYRADEAQEMPSPDK